MSTDLEKSSKTQVDLGFNRVGYRQIGGPRYALLSIAVMAQLATVLITWQLWEIRTTPPNLPLISWPAFPVAVFMVVSLAGVLIDPFRGFVLHVLLMILACLMDQYRMQPQFLANIMLMLATLSSRGKVICFWFLATMWLWAGLHKLFSPDWFAHASYWLLERAQFSRGDALAWHQSYAWFVLAMETGLGILALARPKFAAIGCVALHAGIVAKLVWIDWNFSVIPWNIATAVIGFWVLWSLRQPEESWRNQFDNYPALQSVVGLTMFILPVGFYFSIFDHGYANVLYSDCLPRARITSTDELRYIRGWDVVNVPFPSERRTLRKYFELVAGPGDKLHIHDPRPRLDDLYFVLGDDMRALKISEQQFYSRRGAAIMGIGRDDRFANFYLRQWGTITQRYYQGNQTSDQNLVSFAYTFDPRHYQPERLELLKGLPNLEELQLAGCGVEDADLRSLGELARLTGLGLSGTGVTDAGLKHLALLPKLELVETENTRVSPAGRRRLSEALARQKKD